MDILAEAKQDYEAGRFKEAAEKYRMVLDADSENVLAHQGLAQCLNRLGQYEEAAAECSRALELDSELAIPHAVLGSIYFRQQRFGKGETVLRKAIELDPTLEEAYVSLGATLSEQGRFQEAVTVLQRALELNPNRSITHYNLNIAYARQKRYSDALGEALRAFQLGLSIKTGWAIVLDVLGYLGEHRRLFLLLWILFLCLPFLVPSLLTLPLFVLSMGYLMLGGILCLRSGQRMRGALLLLLVVALAIMYLCNMLYRFGIEREERGLSANQEVNLSFEVNNYYWETKEILYFDNADLWNSGRQERDILVVDLTVTNKSKRSVPLAFWYVTDAEGQRFESILSVDIPFEEDISIGAIRSGGLLRGKVAFEVPRGHLPLWVHCAGDTAEAVIR